MPQIQPYRQFDLSGALQTATSRLLKKRNEVASSKNAAFNKKIGSAIRRDGYEQVGVTIEQGKDGLGAHVFKYFAGDKIFTANNNVNDSRTLVRYLSGQYWTELLEVATPNTHINFQNYLDEVYVAGAAEDTNTYMPITNIDSSLDISTTRNVYGAPRSKF